MPGTAQRWGGRANPRDLTGVRQRQILADQAAREEAENPARNAREDAYEDGRAFGEELGELAFRKALVSLYKDEGIEAIREFLEEELAND
jgi:hypothetical protein